MVSFASINVEGLDGKAFARGEFVILSSSAPSQLSLLFLLGPWHSTSLIYTRSYMLFS